MSPKQYTVLFFLSSICLNDGLRILVWFPLFSKSHSILGKGICTHLLEAGHEVVHITSFPEKEKRENLTEIKPASFEKEFKKNFVHNDQFKLRNMVGQKNFGDSLFFLYMAYEIHRYALEDETVLKLFADPTQKFDAVILEWFYSDLIAGIPPLFQAPLIWVGSTEAHWQVLKLVDDIPNPAYTVDLFSLSRPPLSFTERVAELWIMVKKQFIINALVVPFEKRLYNTVFPDLASKRGVSLPSYDDAVYNGSFLLLYSHPSIGTPFRLPQNAKYVGGYHVDTKVKDLPTDLKKIMDETKHGVIYFSMGSNLKSADMTENMKRSLLKMFSRLKQDVIWKLEEGLQDVPANVHLVKWAPQQSILAHRNLKIFITHGGQLSTTEAIHFGVPVIGIPVFGDQYVNMQSTVVKGFGIKVTLAEDMADNIYNAIKDIFNDPTYKAKATEISAIYHDRPMQPGQEVAYWVEYVVRSHGAKHLKSHAVLVPMYQKLYLDFFAIVTLILAVLFVATKRLLRRKVIPATKSEKKAKCH